MSRLRYASRKGATFLDRRLYLPESRVLMRNTRRCGKTARFPMRPPAETKHELAAQLVEEIVASERLPASWIVCDEGYGDFPAFLQRLDATGLW